MNLKKTAIALAVASVTATPIIAAADAAVYASMRYGFEYVDNKRVAATAAVAQVDHVNGAGPGVAPVAAVPAGNENNSISQFKNYGSRFGIKGETDLGNGLTAFGQWEANMSDGSLRDLKIGVKGDFGTLFMGDKINHAWDTIMTTDNTWWYGGDRHLTEGVQSNALTYQNTWGTIGLGVTVSARPESNNANEETANEWELVGTWNINSPIYVALGLTDNTVNESDTTSSATATDPETIYGIIVGGQTSNWVYAFDYQWQDDSSAGNDAASSWQIDASFGNFYGQYGSQDRDSQSNTPTTLILGYTHNIGPRTLMYFEYAAKDEDTSQDTENTFAAVLKYDLL
jgi:predicted porin